MVVMMDFIDFMGFGVFGYAGLKTPLSKQYAVHNDTVSSPNQIITTHHTSSLSPSPRLPSK